MPEDEIGDTMKAVFATRDFGEDLQYPGITSDLKCGPYDALEMLFCANSKGDALPSVLRKKMKKKHWVFWSDASHAEGDGEQVKIFSPEDKDDYVIITKSQLSKIVDDWELYRKHEQPMTREY